MKSQEILLASGLVAAVVGAGAALAMRIFIDAPGRLEPQARAVESAVEPVGGQPRTDPDVDSKRALVELRLENSTLSGRVAALEARLAEVASTRTPLEVQSAEPESGALASQVDSRANLIEGFAASPTFAEGVSQVLQRIRAEEEAERETKRKELQAQRIEERLTRLQAELGLTGGQVKDVRSALITYDDRREALFTETRDGAGDPRDMRERYRTIRDETRATLEGVLTPQQFEIYKQSDERDGGRDFRGGFPGGGPPPGEGSGSRRPGR